MLYSQIGTSLLCCLRWITGRGYVSSLMIYAFWFSYHIGQFWFFYYGVMVMFNSSRYNVCVPHFYVHVCTYSWHLSVFVYCLLDNIGNILVYSTPMTSCITKFVNIPTLRQPQLLLRPSSTSGSIFFHLFCSGCSRSPAPRRLAGPQWSFSRSFWSKTTMLQQQIRHGV